MSIIRKLWQALWLLIEILVRTAMLLLILPIMWLFGGFFPIAYGNAHGSLIAGLFVAFMLSPILLAITYHAIATEIRQITRSL